MEFTSIIIAIISVMGNIMQFLLNKKSTDTRNMKSQLDYINGVLKTQGEAYKAEKKLHEKQMGDLQDVVSEQGKTLKNNNEEILKLRRMVAKLFGKSCHIDDCVNRSPYTIEEINEMTKNNNNKQNGKSIK